MLEDMDIGEGHRLEFRYFQGEVDEIFDYHINPKTGQECYQIACLSEGWEITNPDPLTVMPSLNCTQCDSHGHILNGQWVEFVPPKETKVMRVKSGH